MNHTLKTIFATLVLAAVPIALAQNPSSDVKKTAKATTTNNKKAAKAPEHGTALSPEQVETLCVNKEDQAERFGRWDEQNKACTPLRLPKKPNGEYSIEEMFFASQTLTSSNASGAVHCDMCTTWCYEGLVCDPRCHYTRTYACGTHSCNCH